MSCEEIRDLIAAYALGTATPEERAAVDEHLETCDLHSGEVAEARAVAAALAGYVPEATPPVSLRDRIMREAREGELLPAARRLRWWTSGYSIAAVLAIAVLGLVAWNVTLQFDDGGQETFVHSYREDDGDWIRVETVFGEPHAAVALGGLDRLAPGREYQLWALRADVPMSIGVFNTNADGKWAGEFRFAFFVEDQIAVTEEPAGGSDAPTMEPLFATRF